MSNPVLTVGMATYRDPRFAWTVQSLLMNQDMVDCEVIVADNDGTDKEVNNFCTKVGARYVLANAVHGTAFPRDEVVRQAKAPHVMIVDCHVLLATNAVARLKAYNAENPDHNDLLSGPRLDDGRDVTSTGFAFYREDGTQRWGGGMWGQWDQDKRGKNINGSSFAIDANGLGLYAFRKEPWPWFHPDFRGFGGEEGYIHDKFRKAGGRCLCLPFLRWWHDFSDPHNTHNRPKEDHFRNNLLGHKERGLDAAPVIQHYLDEKLISVQSMKTMVKEIYGNPNG